MRHMAESGAPLLVLVVFSSISAEWDLSRLWNGPGTSKVMELPGLSCRSTSHCALASVAVNSKCVKVIKDVSFAQVTTSSSSFSPIAVHGIVSLVNKELLLCSFLGKLSKSLTNICGRFHLCLTHVIARAWQLLGCHPAGKPVDFHGFQYFSQRLVLSIAISC